MLIFSLSYFKEVYIFLEYLVLFNATLNVSRGAAVPNKAKKQQSIGIKSFYSNTSSGFEYIKILHN